MAQRGLIQGMTPQNAGKTGRKMWREHRDEYLNKRKFGEEGRNDFIEYDKAGRPIIEFMDSDGRAWQENMAIVSGQIMAMKFSRSNSPLFYNLPSGLSENAIRICEAVINRENIHPVSKLIRFSNGRKMNTAAIGVLAGITGKRTAQRAVKELVDNGVFLKIKRGEYRLNDDILKKVS